MRVDDVAMAARLVVAAIESLVHRYISSAPADLDLERFAPSWSPCSAAISRIADARPAAAAAVVAGQWLRSWARPPWQLILSPQVPAP
jgi:hypothetical protein